MALLVPFKCIRDIFFIILSDFLSLSAFLSVYLSVSLSLSHVCVHVSVHVHVCVCACMHMCMWAIYKPLLFFFSAHLYLIF